MQRSIYPPNHWNPGVLSASTVLNTLTVQSNRVEVETDSVESALPESVVDMTPAYRYRGELNLHSW